MIKATLNRGDKKILILGVSKLNVERLQKDMPIKVLLSDINQVDLSCISEIVIMYGETEQTIMDELQKHADLPPLKIDPTLA